MISPILSPSFSLKDFWVLMCHLKVRKLFNTETVSMLP